MTEPYDVGSYRRNPQKVLLLFYGPLNVAFLLENLQVTPYIYWFFKLSQFSKFSMISNLIITTKTGIIKKDEGLTTLWRSTGEFYAL